MKDKIKILNINTDTGTESQTLPYTFDRDWEITEEFRGIDGYVDTKKIQVTFSDTDDDGVVDRPIIFDEIVNPTVTPLTKYIIQQKYEISQGQEDYRWISNLDDKVIILSTKQGLDIATYLDGQYFYFVDTASVEKLNKSINLLAPSLDYKVYIGRDALKFKYINNADYESRIDPGVTNLMDIYILTRRYDASFRQWLDGTITSEPLPPSSDSLYTLLSPELNKIKSIHQNI